MKGCGGCGWCIDCQLLEMHGRGDDLPAPRPRDARGDLLTPRLGRPARFPIDKDEGKWPEGSTRRQLDKQREDAIRARVAERNSAALDPYHHTKQLVAKIMEIPPEQLGSAVPRAPVPSARRVLPRSSLILITCGA